MPTSPLALPPFIDAVQLFLSALGGLAASDPGRSLELLDARAILARDLNDLKQAQADGDDQGVALAILAIVNADAGMAESGIDVEQEPLRTPWNQVQDSAAPLLSALSG